MIARRLFRLDNQNPFTGWHMLVIVCSFFGVVIAVNTYMAVSAMGTFPGLIVNNSYVASQKYNGVLADARDQARSGWHLETRSDDGALIFRFSSPEEMAAGALDVSVIAGRPSTTRYDRSLQMKADGDVLRAVEILPDGVWEIDVEASLEGTPVFRERRRIVIDGGRDR